MPTDPAIAAWLPAYLRAREREGRLLPDEVVARLPEVPRGHPLHGEWQARADSARRLLAYVGDLPRPLAVMDIGCGNGWLAAAVARRPDTLVSGIDPNERELAQAVRVFAGLPNLEFRLGDVLLVDAPAVRPDMILLASVIQYVADLPALIVRLGSWLADGGEIHVLDSPLYETAGVPAAQERSRQHYVAVGVPEMAAAYHHHTWASIERFAPAILHQPAPTAGRLLRRLGGRVESPFPWLRIRGQDAR